MKPLFLLIFWYIFLGNVTAFATLSERSPEQWAVGIGMRSARSPFVSDKKPSADVIPYLQYKEGLFELNGLEARLTVYRPNHSRWKLNLLGKYRFTDIPQNYENNFKGGAFDFGLEGAFHSENSILVQAQLLSDRKWKKYFVLRMSSLFPMNNLLIEPYSWVQIKSSQFNDKYFNIGNKDSTNDFGLGLGYTLGVGMKLKYQLLSNLHLYSDFNLSVLDEKTKGNQFTEHSVIHSNYVGLFISQKSGHKKNYLKSKRYLKTTYALATPSDLQDIFLGKIKSDRYQHRLFSIAYGIPISDRLFGLEIPLYFTPKVVQHFSSEVQSSFNEYVLAIKAYLPFQKPFKWRLGFGEGLSYVERITFVEGSELAKKGFAGNRLLNYLDFSMDVHLGSAFGLKALNSFWLGLSIHHRSGIFKSSSLFGRISGGSNYNGLSLYYDF